MTARKRLYSYVSCSIHQVQALSGPITSIAKLSSSTDNIAVVWTIDDFPVGYAKLGYKNLFIYTRQGQVVECPNTPCLLDFYVSERLQRGGIGKTLFDEALQVVLDMFTVFMVVY